MKIYLLLMCMITTIAATLTSTSAQPSRPAPGGFSDVSWYHWAADSVEFLSKTGALKGLPDGKFHGDRPVTRYEWATAKRRALNAHCGPDTTDQASALKQVTARMNELQARLDALEKRLGAPITPTGIQTSRDKQAASPAGLVAGAEHGDIHQGPKVAPGPAEKLVRPAQNTILPARLLPLASKPVGTPSGLSVAGRAFPDVAPDHWAAESVEFLAMVGITQGHPGGKFQGDRPMTRYEWATAQGSHTADHWGFYLTEGRIKETSVRLTALRDRFDALERSLGLLHQTT